MKQMIKKINFLAFGVAAVFLTFSSASEAQTPPTADQVAAIRTYCDPVMPPMSPRYEQNLICLSTPTHRSEVTSDSVVLQGKLKTRADLERLVDWTVFYDFASNPLMGPGGVIVPSFESLSSEGAFRISVPVETEGAFDITLNARFLKSDGTYENVSTTTRRVFRAGPPDVTVLRARAGDIRVDSERGNCRTSNSGCYTVTEGMAPTGVAHVLQLAPPTRRTTVAELCIARPVAMGESPQEVGQFTVEAVNTVTDGSKILTLRASCGTGTERCEVSELSDDFCPGGIKFLMGLANGQNVIEVNVSNATGQNQHLQVSTNVDLKGPDLCVRYFNALGREITNVDGKVLLASETADASGRPTDQVLLDVTLGRCGQRAETVTAPQTDGCRIDAENLPLCGNSPICLRKQNEFNVEGDQSPIYRAMCATTVGGEVHYQAPLRRLRFPINLATIQAKDNLGNVTQETHSFTYGKVTPLFDERQRFAPHLGAVQEGFGAYITESYLQNTLKPLILRAVNSVKFKNDFFPKLLDPVKPSQQEVDCLTDLQHRPEVNSSMAHLGARDDHGISDISSVVAIKPFIHCDESSCDVGRIDIPSLYLADGNRIRVQLLVNNLVPYAEMYAASFLDADGDGVYDNEDVDADNDGICDRFFKHFGTCTHRADGKCVEDAILTIGKGFNRDHYCKLDKTLSCPNDVHANDKDFGCADNDDDGDGVLDDQDSMYRVGMDRDFLMQIIPLRLTLRQLAINVDVTIGRDAAGNLDFRIDPANPAPIMQWSPTEGHSKPISFQCDQATSRLYQGGNNRDGLLDGRGNRNGQHLPIDRNGCARLLALESEAQNGFERQDQNTAKQLLTTIHATARCSVPSRLKNALLDTQLDETHHDALMNLSAEIFDNRYFSIDFLAPFNKANIFVNRSGLGVSSSGLAVPAEVRLTPPGDANASNDVSSRTSFTFMNQLAEQYKSTRFGPVSPYDSGPTPSGINEAFMLGGGAGMSLAIKEETINSLLHSVGILMDKLSSLEGDQHQSADLSGLKLREDFDMGVPNSGGGAECYDKDGHVVPTTSWKCFPFALNAQNVLGQKLDGIDFNGNGVIDDRDRLVPMILRTQLLPWSPPTVKIASISRYDVSPGVQNMILEVEVGLGDMLMSVYEEQVANWNATVRVGDRNVPVVNGTGQIKNWCDLDRAPQANVAKCRAGGVLPIATFKATGRVMATVVLSSPGTGLLKIEGGLSSVPISGPTAFGESMELDKLKTYLHFTTVESHVPVSDKELADEMKNRTEILISSYVFGNNRQVSKTIPVQLPLADLCTNSALARTEISDVCECIRNPAGEDCDSITSVQDAWNGLELDQFGIHGVTLPMPFFEYSGPARPTRYLGIGVEPTFQYTPAR